MEQPQIILSLHRPYQKPLKSVSWVCTFIAIKKNKKIKPSTFYSEFFFYFINQLNKEYSKAKTNIEIDGVPSEDTISQVIEYFSNVKKNEKGQLLKEILANRKSDIDRKIYSTYKAISYYINFSKEKLGFIDEKYKLTEVGKKLLKCKSTYFYLSNSEKSIIFGKLFEADALMITSKLLSERLKSKNKLFIEDFHIKFIEDVYKVTYFKYTQTSLISNYDNVRAGWFEQLNILNSFSNIRKFYMDIIIDNHAFNNIFNEIQQKFQQYSSDKIQTDNKNHKLMQEFKLTYKLSLKKGSDDLGFVNLHSIRSEMRMSINRFEKLLSDYYEINRRKEMILFSNTVSSIDKGHRFYVKNKPVIKIKII